MKPRLDHPDDELERWDAMRHGDSLSFKWIYNRYFAKLYGYGRKIGVAERELQDSLHDVFVDLWYYHENLSSIQSVKLYLYQAWRRKVNRYISHQSLVNSIELLLDNKAPAEEPPAGHETAVEDQDGQAQQLRKLINDLAPRQYEALVLLCYEDFNCAEIADILDLDDDTVQSLVQRGLAQLKQFSKLVIPD